MEIAITTLLTLIEAMIPELPALGGATAIIDKIIASLISIIPIIANLFPAMLTSVKGIISALQSSGPATADQIAQLQALDAQCDQAFEAAAAAAGAPATTAPSAS